jgi:hypothetical protein
MQYNSSTARLLQGKSLSDKVSPSIRENKHNSSGITADRAKTICSHDVNSITGQKSLLPFPERTHLTTCHSFAPSPVHRLRKLKTHKCCYPTQDISQVNTVTGTATVDIASNQLRTVRSTRRTVLLFLRSNERRRRRHTHS